MSNTTDLEFGKFDQDGKVRVSLDGSKVNVTDLVTMLRAILIAIANPSYVDKTTNAMRTTVTATIATLTTLTGVTNIDSYQGKILMISSNKNAWANSVRRQIS